MNKHARMITVAGTIGTMVAIALVAPGMIGAIAEEPVAALSNGIDQLFPAPVDIKKFRKYAITFDESVSTEVEHTSTVKKIAFGHASNVSIVTTPTGTYSSDGLLSPNVRYPGIEVKPKHRWSEDYSFGSFSSESGTGSWSSFSRGSIIFYNYSFTPSARS